VQNKRRQKTNVGKIQNIKQKRRNKFTRAVFRVARIKINKNMAIASNMTIAMRPGDDHDDVGAMEIDPGVRLSTVRTINQWGRRRRRRHRQPPQTYIYFIVHS